MSLIRDTRGIRVNASQGERAALAGLVESLNAMLPKKLSTRKRKLHGRTLDVVELEAMPMVEAHASHDGTALREPGGPGPRSLANRCAHIASYVLFI